MNRQFYVTTPIYYVNDSPHIGHAYTTIAADILARYNRLKQKEVFFLTGTDEHGQKIERAARDKGHSPQEHADLYVGNFKELWKCLNISYDAFIRTTDVSHKQIVQAMLQRIKDKGEIEKRTYKGMYCTPCERFWTAKDLINGNCPDCMRPVEEIEESNYFFLMSRYQERLIRHIQENDKFILPESRRNEVLGFLTSNPLGDLCISRPKSRLSWGILLPFDDDYVTYVWFDALANYLSATLYLCPPSHPADNTDKDILHASCWWPAAHQLIGKDILTTHAVYWSTMLMAIDLPLPENIFAHGWWTIEGKKMSKSLGNVVNPADIANRFGVDAFRFFLFREVPFGLDGDFSEAALIKRINVDLANDLGNLTSRILMMIGKYCSGRIPNPGWADREIKDLALGLYEKVDKGLAVLAFHRVLEEIWALISALNKYIDASQPWKLWKPAAKPDERELLDTVLYSSAEGLRFVALYLLPFMPESAEKILRQLGIEKPVSDINLQEESKWGQLPARTQIKRPEPLFPRIEVKKTKEAAQAPMDNNIITIEDFAKVELKIGKVLEAERVPKSDKLIKMQVDTGEIRQLVAGIGKYYAPEDLIGKKITVVCNLKPAKLMGVESKGMLLAATDSNGRLSILTLDREVSEGAKVK